MGEEPEATLIVTLSGPVDFDAIKKSVMKISGVNSVELIWDSNKLRVKYDADMRRNLAIREDVMRAIASFSTVYQQ